MKIVLATRNKGKIREFKKLLGESPFEIIGLDSFPEIGKIKEDGKTFQENAIKKACYVAKNTGIPSISDDSGLVVYALGGLPGIYSARFAGEGATDLENNLKLLKEMENVKDRRAEFVCVIAICLPNGKSRIYEGRCKGIITERLMGDKGFGYDPLFYYPPFKKTFAQMEPDEKNRISHRAEAIRKLKSDLPSLVEWIRKEGYAKG